MNVLVMGTGGVGGYLGALLGRAGHRLTVIARGHHLDALQSDGLRVESVADGEFKVAVHALSTAEPDVVPNLVLFTVKSPDTGPAIGRIRSAVGPNTTILTLLNGVDSGEELAAAFGPEHVLDGCIYIECFIRSPGVIAQTGGPRRIVFGNRNGENGEREKMLLDTFTEAGWNAELSDNMLGALWSKFAYLGPFAAVNTITGMGPAKLCSEDRCSRLLHAVVSEYTAVGNADGAALPDDIVTRTMDALSRSTIRVSSMLRDRMANKPLESEALVGTVVRRGARHGVPTPITETLYCLLGPMADGGAAQLG